MSNCIFDEDYAPIKNKCSDEGVVRLLDYIVANIMDDTQHYDIILDVLNGRKTKTEDELMSSICEAIDEERANNDQRP